MRPNETKENYTNSASLESNLRKLSKMLAICGPTWHWEVGTWRSIVGNKKSPNCLTRSRPEQWTWGRLDNPGCCLGLTPRSRHQPHLWSELRSPSNGAYEWFFGLVIIRTFGVSWFFFWKLKVSSTLVGFNFRVQNNFPKARVRVMKNSASSNEGLFKRLQAF